MIIWKDRLINIITDKKNFQRKIWQKIRQIQKRIKNLVKDKEKGGYFHNTEERSNMIKIKQYKD